MTTWGAGLAWSRLHRSWCGFFRVEPDKSLLLRHELTWFRQQPRDAAHELRAMMNRLTIDAEGKDIGRFHTVVADPWLFPKPKARGATIAESFHRAGVPLTRGDDDRLNGFSQLGAWLTPMVQWDGQNRPSLTIHADCTYFLRTLPTLVSDETNPEDVQANPYELPARGAMYFVMSRPMPSKAEEPDLPPGAIGHDLRKAREDARLGV